MGSVAKLFKMKALLIFILLGAMNLQRGDSVQWVLGPQGEGDCHEICATKKGTCDERIGREAASDPNRVNFTGIGCKGRNGWDYGQGFSQCLDKGCCWDSSCQFHCSATSRWPGCKIENGPWNGDGGHHGRLCPCRVSERTFQVDKDGFLPCNTKENCPDGFHCIGTSSLIQESVPDGGWSSESFCGERDDVESGEWHGVSGWTFLQSTSAITGNSLFSVDLTRVSCVAPTCRRNNKCCRIVSHRNLKLC